MQKIVSSKQRNFEPAPTSSGCGEDSGRSEGGFHTSCTKEKKEKASER